MKIYEGFFLWFSEYYHLYNKSIETIMSDDNYIPITWKYYLAIMAISTVKSQYLLRQLEIQFLSKGGDETWLIKGLTAVPEKIKKLDKLNNILAHQPWKLKVQDINEVYNKYDSQNGWGFNELIQAVVILAYHHRLAAIIESLKLNIKTTIGEDDLKDQKNEDIQKSEDYKILKYIGNEENVKKKIISELEIINQAEEKPGPDNHRKYNEETVTNKLNSSFDKSIISHEFTKHISNFCTIYLDFDSHSEEFNSLLVRIYL